MRILKSLLVILLFITWSHASAQDLEPRRWSHLPAGLNVGSLFTGWSDGDVYFDPALKLENVDADTWLSGVAYVRAFDLLGRTARVDIKLPYASQRWEGLLDGQYATTRRRGFMDPRLRFSVNLIGAPALRGKAYVEHMQSNPVNTTVGAALEVVLPLGDYNDSKLINLGGNRMVYRPQLGVLHQRRNWQFELTGSVFLYGDNDEFWNGSRYTQDPLWFAQAHLIRSFRPGWWASLSAGYAYGGESKVNSVPNDDARRTLYGAASLGMPTGRKSSLKLTYFFGDTHVSTGMDSHNLLIGWSFSWGM